MYMLPDNEFIFNEKDNQITNIGFSLNSIMDKFKHIVGGGDDDRATKSSVTEHLTYVAVPTTLYLNLGQVLGRKYRQEINDDQVLSDDLHDKLLELIEDKPVKKNSKKNRKSIETPTPSDSSSKKKTRKNR
jgi:hypothetical protein